MNKSPESPILSPEVPVVFADGTAVYQKLIDEFGTHEKGLFILAPSGAGKTHYIKNNHDEGWIDGDILWDATGAHPNCDWWTHELPVLMEVDRRSDIVTRCALNVGLWVMGASSYDLVPDAIVLPEWETHRKYILTREKEGYDGGAKSSDFEQVQEHRQWIEAFHTKHKAPLFTSVEEAVRVLTK